MKDSTKIRKIKDIMRQWVKDCDAKVPLSSAVALCQIRDLLRIRTKKLTVKDLMEAAKELRNYSLGKTK